MPNRDPLTYPYHSGLRRLQNLNSAMRHNSKRPPIGVTQGGSSRSSPGAKPAATTAKFRPTKMKPERNDD